MIRVRYTYTRHTGGSILGNADGAASADYQISGRKQIRHIIAIVQNLVADSGGGITIFDIFKICPACQMNYLPGVGESIQLVQQLTYCFVDVFRAARCTGYKQNLFVFI